MNYLIVKWDPASPVVQHLSIFEGPSYESPANFCETLELEKWMKMSSEPPMKNEFGIV
jgi:hypothetical protein